MSKKNPFDLDGVVADFNKRSAMVAKEIQKNQPGLGPMPKNPVSVGERVLSADEWAKKMTERATAAAGTWKTQVLKPRRDPVTSAIAASGKRKERLLTSLEQLKWEKAMGKVDKDEMYKVIEATGEESFRRGIESRSGKIAKRVSEIQPLVKAAAETIDKMPDATDADREKRLLAARRLMIEVGKKRRGIA